MLFRNASTAMIALASVLNACSSSSTTPDSGNPADTGTPPVDAAGPVDSGSDAAVSQTPPMGHDALEAWLTAGAYRSWHCETAVHASRNPSPHGFNRICSNNLVAANATGTSNWPQGSAAVKELYDTATSAQPIGYAVYLKLAADSGAGANWYWYERVPAASPFPHDANGVVADGVGTSGPPLDICVGCHVAAGTDAPHTPTTGGRDFVYTPVP